MFGASTVNTAFIGNTVSESMIAVQSFLHARSLATVAQRKLWLAKP
jgi:hypothetical protein